MPQKLIIDADPGIGDAIAIAAAMVDPEIDLLAVTATAGRVSGPDATRNIQVIVELLDPTKWPRIGGCELPCPQFDASLKVALATAAALNGPTGLGDLNMRVAELHRPQDAAKLMVDFVRNYPNEITLLTLGPLTNVEVACELAPEFLELVRGIVCQAGSITGRGDITASAEFNVCANPEAARNILRSPATKTLVPLETSRKPVLTFDQFDKLDKTASRRMRQLLGELLPFAFRAHHQHLGEEGMRLHELVALASVARPKLFDREAMAIDVETRGELTRGMTVFDRRGIAQWQTNIDVLVDADPRGVLDYFMETIQYATV